ncbi:MAG: phosphoribosylaminoimidazolesuccinocarboxamide synthase, partial [Gemmatimonadota bacterium]|nr:phosphoribosylaminoimidazolesuccinocarboxamide synthase [Gemmatimonadota bacterium]
MTAELTPVALTSTNLPLPLVRRGKVRDVYAVGDDLMLLVTTDRISAFDVVMHEAIPHKGAVLTQLTAWWLSQLADRVPHHMVTANTDDIVTRLPELLPFRDALHGRAMLCVRADVVPIECVIRGYLSGSAWKEYKASGTLAGERLADGMRESDRLASPIFSPATKAESGHDENITIAQVRREVGDDVAQQLETLARTIYAFGRDIAANHGIIVADTKFEFGWHAGKLLLIDEVLTPDSSRFWSAADYAPGRGQAS